MRVRVILNRDGGTLKTTDIGALTAHVENAFTASGHQVDVDAVHGREISGTLKDAAGADAVECIVVGGGDGTVSHAAGICWKAGKVLGVLPAGTMNLFARSLGMPLSLDLAVEALAGAPVGEADICTVNDHVFVHQVSVGVQPRMVELRNAIPYRSRIGKINASVKAALKAIVRPPSFRARLKGGEIDTVRRYSILAISNNVYGDGHLPYADDIDGGVLGIYTSPPLGPVNNLRLARDFLLRRWTSNEHFLSQSGDRVEIDILSRSRGRKMSVDGELLPLPQHLDIRLHARELKVLRLPLAPVPSAA